MEEFADNVKILINALGYKVLEPIVQNGKDLSDIETEKLYLNVGGVSAVGATVNEKSSTSLSTGIRKLREEKFAEGKVSNLITTEDILFSSSSAAADFILGYSASGPRSWKAKDGRLLKEIENNMSND